MQIPFQQGVRIVHLGDTPSVQAHIEPVGLPAETFAEIWERDGQWILGPHILGDLVRWMTGRTLYAKSNPGRPNAIEIAVPLPCINWEIGGKQPLSSAMHVSLHDIFDDRLQLAITLYTGSLRNSLYNLLGRPNSDSTLHEVNSIFHSEENRRKYNDEQQWYQLFATCFGLVDSSLPSPSALQFVEDDNEGFDRQV